MKEILQDIQTKLLGEVYTNEEQIRLSLVSRILQSLGWNIWNPKEVWAEYSAVPEEDRGRVDLALFVRSFAPSVYIEVKALGKLDTDLERTERQLRDYNRNNTALFTIITDGRQWRFYYSQTGGEFSKKCFKIFDLIDDDLDDIEKFLLAFFSKSELITDSAKEQAEHYLRLNQKQRVMEDALPKARRLVQEPPFPSLPEALRDLAAPSGFSLTLDEAQKFITDSASEPAPTLPRPAIPVAPQRVLPSEPDNGRAPEYLSTYRAMLRRPDTLPSRMLRYIQNAQTLTYGDLKKACVRELGYKSESSGSIGASLKVLELDGHVVIDGFGDRKRISILRKPHPN